MIGVIAKTSELRIAEEFFQLFKTPWEFCVTDRIYDVVITTGEDLPKKVTGRLLVVYSSVTTRFDDHLGVATESIERCSWVDWQDSAFPVYGDLAGFRPVGQPLMCRQGTLDPVGTFVAGSEYPVVRIGYDLFSEVEFLLSQGQPARNAQIPTLDTHISLLRAIMVQAGVPFVEVPPVPAGCDFMACLTHDVDFVGIRDHKCDHTMWGFLYRCLVGSLVRTVRGELPWAKCRQNWTAALSLPLVYLGLRDDFWLEFERYMEIERGLGATFFFIPLKGVAGTLGSTPAPDHRAAKYDIAGIREQVVELVRKGFEVGLHGIDAWQDSQSARSEQRRVSEVAGLAVVGTRMHWLYWMGSSPKALEDAGMAYDSTFGYNDAIGFRAGTSQSFCPIGAERLLELPLNIQDSAMFYPDRMGLSEEEALNACKGLIGSMLQFGGALTVNWHTRSLSAERLWGDFYALLLKEVQTHRVWFANAREIVRWFRERRALRFDSVQFEENGVRVSLSNPAGCSGPPFTVRLHHPKSGLDASGALFHMPAHTDNQWAGEEALEIAY